MKKVVILLLSVLCAASMNACGHEHTYADATCTTPKTCTKCEATEGEPLGHTYADATCTEPKTCKVCGAVEGEPLGHSYTEATCTEPGICTVCKETGVEALGHSTEIGICERCGEYQGKESVVKILDNLQYANAQTDLALVIQLSGTDLYNNINKGFEYYETAKEKYNESAELCADYPELSSLKEDILKTIEALPLTVQGSDLESIDAYLDDLEDFAIAKAQMQIDMVFVEENIN